MGTVPPRLPVRREGKPQLKDEHPSKHPDNAAIPVTYSDLLPLSEHTGRPYDPSLISGLSRKEQRRVANWFYGLPDVPGAQSNSATLALMDLIRANTLE